MSAYSPMSHPGYFNGMSAMTKPQPIQVPFATMDNKSKHNMGPASKRRASRAGTRSVATLTAAQLERKRANDREAQRAIRQRTKDHIDSLERRIAELTSNSDINTRLAQALQRADELEQENKLFRSRLNSAVQAVAEGQPITQEMLTGPDSPTRRLRIQTRSSSVPNVSTVPRSVPNSATIPMQDQWNQTFSPVTTAVDRSPSLADVSPVSTSLRWGAHPQPSPGLSDHGMAPQSVEHVSQAGSVRYGYIMDGSERHISYSPSAEHAMMAPYPTPTHSEPVNGYGPPHSGSMSQAIPSPAYNQFPGTPQSFIGSPHESDGHMHMMQQRTPIENQQMMYSVPNNLKDD